MELFGLLAIISLAGLIHASFQLSISVVTLLSGHSLGAKQSSKRLFRLVGGFLAGALTATMLTVSFLAYAVSTITHGAADPVYWAIVSGIMFGVGVATWLFYYRRQSGTALWVPRPMARFLQKRTKATASASESFSLGVTSVFSESLFIVAPVAATAVALTHMPSAWQLPGLFGYTLLANLGLIIVIILIGSGHSLSHIQRWREANKGFLQFAAGSALVVLGLYIYVNGVMSAVLSYGSL